MEPDAQRCAGLLEDRSGQRVDVISARLASEGRAPFDAVVFLRLLVAFVAVGDAAGEALLFDRFETSVIIWELPVKLLKGIAKMGWNCLAAIHNTPIIAFSLPCCQGIFTPPFPVSIGIIGLGRFSSQSLEPKIVTGKVLNQKDLVTDFARFSGSCLTKY